MMNIAIHDFHFVFLLSCLHSCRGKPPVEFNAAEMDLLVHFCKHFYSKKRVLALQCQG